MVVEDDNKIDRFAERQHTVGLDEHARSADGTRHATPPHKQNGKGRADPFLPTQIDCLIQDERMVGDPPSPRYKFNVLFS